MYTVEIIDQTRNVVATYEHIVKIEYYSVSDTVMVEDDAILTHHFPLDCDMVFFSAISNYTVSADLLGVLEISKED